MNIGIVGTGNIGTILARKLSAAGHNVKVANSRGPETIESDVVANGAHAVTATEAMTDIDVAILSIPLSRIPDIAPLIKELSPETVVVDTSNYYPQRDGEIEEIEAGQVESLWVVERLGRPIVKAWNNIGSGSLAIKGTPVTASGRIALAVAADNQRDREAGMALVEETGFEAFDSEALAESWRQQPGAPCYCTDLTHEEVGPALAAAEKTRLPKRRDLAVAAIMERVGDGKTNPDAGYGTRLSRALYM